MVDADQRRRTARRSPPPSPAPMANAAVCTHGTGMPIACAMTRSCVVARIQMPYLPYLRNSQKPPMIAADSAAITSR